MPRPNLTVIKSFRLFDFHSFDDKPVDNDGDDDASTKQKKQYKDELEFTIQVFGVNETGETCCIYITDFQPFFYLKVGENWTESNVSALMREIKGRLDKSRASHFVDSIISARLVEYQKLYGFSGGKKDKFVKLTFKNTVVMNKVKNMWFIYENEMRKRIKFMFQGISLELYESNIPPLLRYFHINNISPSGWVSLPTNRVRKPSIKTSTCKYEYICEVKQLKPMPEKETRVPYKICSFDIEASSSHGDFPLPIKTYKRLASNIVDVFIRQHDFIDGNVPKSNKLLQKLILTAFNYDKYDDIDLVYPKIMPTIEYVKGLIQVLLKSPIEQAKLANNTSDNSRLLTIDSIFEQIKNAKDMEDTGGGGGDDDGEQEVEFTYSSYNRYKKPTKIDKSATLIDILISANHDRETKIQLTNDVMTMLFPNLEGDKVTFIGSTFMRYGEPETYLNHCLVLGSCDPVEGAVIESVEEESDLLLKWAELIQQENPDIIIGYNIFGFDYEFMFRRAQETHCTMEFLKLSRKPDEICAKYNHDKELELDNTKLKIASGEYDLRFLKMTGRLQIDMYAYFRRDFNLSSYKLDDVAGQYISDDVNRIEYGYDMPHGDVTELYSKNLTGLHVGDFIHIEITGFTTDYYGGGKKFKVLRIDTNRMVDEVIKGKSVMNKYNVIVIAGKHEIDMSKSIKWGMSKDDVTPQDIFRLANGDAKDRAIVAKYCIQDCNLVHHLMNKIDVITGYVEMASICSVPISFLVFRGQGIKLTSYVAKKCRDKNTLMPDLEKGADGDGYEGAIVLPPKCSMYMDNPVACVDYASLYPSSMISQNLSHDSKVWTKEYDLSGNLLHITGERIASGEFKYDNLPGYEYIDLEFDTFKYTRKTPTSKAEKVKSGKMVCRWAQFPDGGKGIMPSILEELLRARANTRKMIKTEKDPFMQNILDKRQLGYKVTANSLYGQCGSRTSTFYERDVAASTTATGRMMITYAKRIIEEVYGDREYNTECHGPVLTKAEYVYGDSVANYTPVYVRVNDNCDICTIEELAKKYGNDNWVTCKEEGKQEKEFCELNGVETWTEKGWTKLYRVIRHQLASHKKMLRILTHTGLVHVTDDHSLILDNGNEISPKDVTVGTKLLHKSCSIHQNKCAWLKEMPYVRRNYDYYYLVKIFLSYLDKRIRYRHSCVNREDVVIFGDFEDEGDLLAEIFVTAELFEFAPRFELTEDGDIILRIHLCTYVDEVDVNQIIQIQEIPYEGYVYDLTTDNHHFAAGIGNMIVHNTDSVFFTFNLQDPVTGEKIRGKNALEMTIEIAQDVAKLCTQWLKAPMELTYEKTLMPFILLSKKRYVGMLYETDANKGKLKYMGLSLKRRDSCDYLKDVYGEIINILMKENNVKCAIDFLNKSLTNLIEGKVSMDKLMITKALRGDYKNPQQIGHKVLADRIGQRDPGNKPKAGDRMKFVFVVNNDKKALMGDKIETPEYILENKLKIDYSHYITNQLMKPLQQLFGLAIEQIWEMNKSRSLITAYKRDMQKLENEFPDTEEFMKKKEKYCSAKIKSMLFDEFINRIYNEKNKIQSITKFYSFK
jgi:DNA polymerase elongation subunit (family B)